MRSEPYLLIEVKDIRDWKYSLNTQNERAIMIFVPHTVQRNNKFDASFLPFEF
jgi:hypothetical protein